MKNYILIFAFLFCATSATMADGNLCEGIQIPVTIKICFHMAKMNAA